MSNNETIAANARESPFLAVSGATNCAICDGAHPIQQCPGGGPWERIKALEADNAGLLALLREIDYAEPARAEWLLAHAREQTHPGRELMARTLEEIVQLHIENTTKDAQIAALRETERQLRAELARRNDDLRVERDDVARRLALATGEAQPCE